MTNDCKTCPVSTGTHKPAEAVHVQIDEPQDEAMRLADECDESATHWVHEIDTRLKAAKMLRAQHARIEDIEAQHREELRAYEITVANREARIAELEDDLQFVERWAVHHGSKPSISAEEALSCIQHYPAIHEITKSYKDGKRPDTFNPYARIAELESQLEAIGAGGVEPLRKPAAPQAVQAAVPVAWRLTNTAFRKPRFEYHDTKESAEQRQADFNRSVDDGGLHNLTPLYAAPARPSEGAPAPAAVAGPDECAAFEQWLGIKPCGAAHDFGWAAWRARAALAATQPAAQAVQPFGWLITKSKLPGDVEFTQDPARENLARSFGYQTQALYDQPAAQGMDAEIQQAVEAERERICAAIKAEDDHCVDQGDYMLDSNDCIKIVRGKWVRPDYSVEAAQAKQGGAHAT